MTTPVIVRRTNALLGYEIPEDITELCDDCHRAVTRMRQRIYG